MPTPDRIKSSDSFWNALDSLSVQRAALVCASRLPLALFNAEARMTTAQLFTMWSALEELGGADIGLDMTLAMRSPTLPPSFLVAWHARNMGEALQRIARYKALCAPEEFHIEIGPEDCVVTTSWIYATKDEPFALTDAKFSFLVNMVRAGTGQQIRPKRLELQRAPSERLQTWFDCPIKWRASQSRLVFHKDDLDIPFTSANHELLAMLDAALEAALNRTEGAKSLTDQVRWHLRRAMTAGRPDLRSIARDMAISERSLQRHLKEEGHCFKALLSDTRHELALEYLAQPDFDISEIAFLLGYEDQGSFYRAFQKWENRTPAEWRNATASTP